MHNCRRDEANNSDRRHLPPSCLASYLPTCLPACLPLTRASVRGEMYKVRTAIYQRSVEPADAGTAAAPASSSPWCHCQRVSQKLKTPSHRGGQLVWVAGHINYNYPARHVGENGASRQPATRRGKPIPVWPASARARVRVSPPPPPPILASSIRLPGRVRGLQSIHHHI